MLRYFCLCLVFVWTIRSTDSLKLPSYVQACSRNDPNLNECAVRNGQKAIPKFIDGDRKYRIPKFNPLLIEEMVMDHGGGNVVGLKMIAKDAELFGLEKSVLKDIKIDLKNRTFDWHLLTPVMSIITKYTVSGRILLVPIAGKGNGNFTLENIDYKIRFNFDLEKKKDGKEYVKVLNSKIDYKIGHAYIRLDGLFNGDKALGNQMNKFLNENWKEVVNEVGPTIADAIAYIATTILSNIADLVPYDEVFPEKV